MEENKKKNISEEFHDIDDIKPRKWLFILLIIIEIVIAVYLANQYVTYRKDNSIFKKVNKVVNNNNFDIKSFNSKFEMQIGTKSGFFLSSLMDDIITNNKTNKDHIILVKFDNTETKDPDEIKDLKKNIGTHDNYEISADYDKVGYINRITIESIQNEDTESNIQSTIDDMLNKQLNEEIDIDIDI